VNHENPVLAFVRDFSEDDAAIMTQVKFCLRIAPTDDETIGLHAVDEYEPRTRLFLATASLLCDKSKIYSAEDKYTREIHWAMTACIDTRAWLTAATGLQLSN
jgi:hypothetical protein